MVLSEVFAPCATYGRGAGSRRGGGDDQESARECGRMRGSLRSDRVCGVSVCERSLVPISAVVGGTVAVCRYQDHVAHSFTLRSDVHSDVR